MIVRYAAPEGEWDETDTNALSWLARHFDEVQVQGRTIPATLAARLGIDAKATGAPQVEHDVLVCRGAGQASGRAPFVLLVEEGADFTAELLRSDAAPLPALLLATSGAAREEVHRRAPDLLTPVVAMGGDDDDAALLDVVEPVGLSVPVAVGMVTVCAHRVVVDLSERDHWAVLTDHETVLLDWVSPEVTASIVRGRGGPLVRLAPSRGSRWARDTFGRRLWRVRKLEETFVVHDLWIDDLELAEYAARHDFARRIETVVLDRPPRGEWSEAQWQALTALSDTVRLQAETEDDRRDVELAVPSLVGRLGWPLSREASGGAPWIHSGPDQSERAGAHVREPIRVLLATHDMKFAHTVVADLITSAGARVDVDQWPTQHHTSDALASLGRLHAAEVVWVEFASGVAEWYSRRVEGQRLVVRVHGYEVEGPWADGIDFERVDAVVFPSDHTRERAVERWALDHEKTEVIPNAVDFRHFDRPKVPDAQFSLGLLGWSPWLKRPDRAVSLLVQLLDRDPRFSLSIKGVPPTEVPWVWNDARTRAHYEGLFQKLDRHPGLRDRVHFEEAGTDVAEWLRHIGWILSPSTRESFHLAVLEGMASGSVPVVWNRLGGDEVFPEACHVDTTAAAVQLVHDVVDGGRFDDLSRQAAVSAGELDISRVRDRWTEVLSPS